MSYNIAIDGPAGAGKSTIAKLLARKLSYIYVDTGAMYRAIALYLLEKGIDTGNEDALAKACEDMEVGIAYQDGEQMVLLNGENVTNRIRTEEVGNAASASSVYPSVRNKLLSLQRELAAKEDVVMDGRDIGTNILPHADLKIYLTASVSTRAKRRYDELLAKGLKEDLDKIEADIKERDDRDKNRKIAPLKQADDAVLVDSSHLNIEEVVNLILSHVKEKGLWK